MATRRLAAVLLLLAGVAAPALAEKQEQEECKAGRGSSDGEAAKEVLVEARAHQQEQGPGDGEWDDSDISRDGLSDMEWLNSEDQTTFSRDDDQSDVERWMEQAGRIFAHFLDEAPGEKAEKFDAGVSAVNGIFNKFANKAPQKALQGDYTKLCGSKKLQFDTQQCLRTKFCVHTGSSCSSCAKLNPQDCNNFPKKCEVIPGSGLCRLKR